MSDTLTHPEKKITDLAEELAKLKAIRFVLWRTKISVDIHRRHLLSLTLDEQYEEFEKENKKNNHGSETF